MSGRTIEADSVNLRSPSPDVDGVYDSTYTFSNLQTDGQPEIGRGLPSIDDIEEEIRKAEEELMPKREERIDQSRGNTNKRNVRVV